MARTSKKTKTATVSVADQRETSSAPANVEAAAVPASGTEVFIPLDKLKKSPRNVRKTPHREAEIEAYAASIAAKGMFQNLVVEPELDADGRPTGFYCVTIGEGRRLAQLLRVKRKEIRKTEPIRCVIDTANDPFEISLDENVTRTAMHPADQFEAFRELAENRGLGAEEIAARFGVTAQVVKQRLRLGAVSPKLMQVYRDGGLTLDQMMAFAITEDHARQEQVHEGLGYNKEPWLIRRELTKAHVAATDRRAIFIGPEAYTEAGGTIIRDLFTEDRGGFYEDAALLDQLVIEKLEGIARQMQEAEGWKWSDVHIDYPHGNGMRRDYANVRQPPISTLNLAHMIPLSAVWAGPASDEHFGAPPLFYAKTEGATPFRFLLHVGDVGHTLVVGPTGAGKSVLLALMALQFRRYENSQIFAFDFGGSMRAATLAMDGDWEDLGGNAVRHRDDNPLTQLALSDLGNGASSVSLQPLAGIKHTPGAGMGRRLAGRHPGARERDCDPGGEGAPVVCADVTGVGTGR